MRYVKAIVHRHELHRQPVTVPPWEIPLLESLFQGVEVVGEIEVKREAPDAAAEYERLERKYREYRDENGDYTGESVVGAVYGRFQQGVNALGRAIADATREPEAKEKPEGRKKSEAA